MPSSRQTLLRLVRQVPSSSVAPPRDLGVDDFALRKGQKYGTILLDLEQRRPIDLLPERSATTLETWLREHPGIEIIARDRGPDYIRGATAGAPDAVQVADRFHLLCNLREVLERTFERTQVYGYSCSRWRTRYRSPLLAYRICSYSTPIPDSLTRKRAASRTNARCVARVFQHNPHRMDIAASISRSEQARPNDD